MIRTRMVTTGLVFLGLVGPAIAGIHEDKANHFDFALPADWIPWPSETLQMANSFARSRALGKDIQFKAGFQPLRNMVGSYPYILVQVIKNPNGNSSYDAIEASLAKVSKTAAQEVKGALADIAKDISIGSAALDRVNNRVVMRYELTAPNVGKVEGITLAMIGKESVVSLHYYDRANQFDESVKTFFIIANSFEFEKEYRFSPRSSPSLFPGLNMGQGTMIMGLVGLCTLMAGGVLWQARGSKNRHTAWPEDNKPWATS